MIKISVFLTRRADLTHEQFVQYWTETHTPLLGRMPATAEHARRYVQLHPEVSQIAGEATADYDGIAEVWVDSIEAADAIFGSEHYRTVIAEDEANFMDRSKTRFLVSTEHVIGG